jgi:ribonuclease HII
MTNELKSFNIKNVIGIDEVGIGCLAGPVVACAVYLDESIMDEIVNFKYNGFGIQDSKTIYFEDIRYYIAHWLKEKVQHEISIIEVDEINKDNNIHVSASKARANACDKLIDKLGYYPKKILIDGNDIYKRSLLKYSEKAKNTSIKAVVKGDNKYYSIAAASIIAKAFRDTYMCALSATIANYNFEKHKGYCTPEHIALIEEYGLCEQHRYFAKKFAKNLTNKTKNNKI